MSTNSAALNGIYLHRLVKCLLPLGTEENDIDAVYEELIEFAQSKHFSRYPALPVDQVLSQCQRSLTSPQFQQLTKTIDQLLKSKDPHDIARYITFAQSVFEETTGALPQHQRNVSNGADNFDRIHPPVDTHSQSNYAATITSFDNDMLDHLSERRSAYSSSQVNGSRASTLEDLLIPYFETHVKDSEVLSSICYTLVGTTSEVFPLKQGEVDLPENMSNGLSGVLHVTLEAGLIYQRLLLIVESSKVQRNNSQTTVALVSFISNELDGYVQLVNTLAVHSQLSLKMIYYTILEPLTKLRFLYYILNDVKQKRSHEVLSTIRSYTFHGDVVIQSCSRSMFKYVLEPFFATLSAWMIHGDLQGGVDDFFIESGSTDSSSQQRPSEVAIFRPEHVPDFIQLGLAQKIYTIGMTNSFLRGGCKEIEWTNQFTQKSSSLLKQLKSKEKFTLGDSNFHKVVNSLYNEIMNYFTHIIYHKFKLQDVLRALCDYLLMSKGDFIESIISKGSQLLSEPSSSLTGHQLTRLLQESVLNTTPRFSILQGTDGTVLNNLDARILAVGHGNVGWDVFTLDYRIDPPLSYILSNPNGDYKREYLRVFNHLWKLKRLSRMFNDRWRESKPSRGSHDKRLRRVMLIRSFIHGFLSSIEGYILLEIIDVSVGSLFEKLCSKSEKAVVVGTVSGNTLKVSDPVLKPSSQFLKSINGSDSSFQRFEHEFNELRFDEIQGTHQEFLASITRHKLLDSSKDIANSNVSGLSYIVQMNNLVDTSFKFLLAEREFATLTAESQDSRYEQKEDARRQQTIYDNLLVLFNTFNDGLKTFVGDLSHDDDTQLRYLGTSLNQ